MKLAVASLLLLSAHLVSTHTCLEGWRMFKDTCYLFVNSKANWEEAAISCSRRSALLATVRNSEVDKWLVAQLNEIPSINELWTGGTYEPKGKYWEWFASGDRITYFNWAPGEPNTPATEHCLQLMSGHGHKWNDALCSEEIPSVCQKEVLVWELFQGKNYMFFDDPQTWEEAKATCAKRDAHLPVFGDAHFGSWLVEQINKHHFFDLWITGKVSTNSKWKGHDSNNPFSEYCIDITSDGKMEFEDINCLIKFPFVCERSY